jgi:hypothetical protein
LESGASPHHGDGRSGRRHHPWIGIAQAAPQHRQKVAVTALTSDGDRLQALIATTDEHDQQLPQQGWPLSRSRGDRKAGDQG